MSGITELIRIGVSYPDALVIDKLYSLLAGRSGGQTLIGGIDAGDNLSLQSTSHATKGLIKLGANSAYDEVNDRLGLNTNAPDATLDVHGKIVLNMETLASGKAFSVAGTSEVDSAIDLSYTINKPAGTIKAIRMAPTFSPQVAGGQCITFSNNLWLRNSSNNVVNCIGQEAKFLTEASYTGTVSNVFGFYVSPPSISGGAVTNIFGIRVDPITGGTNNFALVTKQGVVVFNEDGTDSDLRIEGDTEPNLFFVDASTDRIGVGTNSPGTELDVVGTIQQSNAYFHAYDTTGGTTIGTSETDIPFDTEVRKDDLYTHSTSTNPDEITIDEAGDYLIHAQFTADSSDSVNRLHAEWRAKVDTGGGFATIAGTEASSYHRLNVDGRDTASMTFIHTFSAGDILKFVGISDSASAITLLADGSRVTIQRI